MVIEMVQIHHFIARTKREQKLTKKFVFFSHPRIERIDRRMEAMIYDLSSLWTILTRTNIPTMKWDEKKSEYMIQLQMTNNQTISIVGFSEWDFVLFFFFFASKQERTRKKQNHCCHIERPDI